METKAAVFYGVDHPLAVERLTLASIQPGEVLVQMGAAGICHSDYHVMTGQAAHDCPVVLGHEGAGKILDVGEGVSELSVGDHVVLSWIPYCGTCFFCEHDQTHLCQTHKGPLWDGTLMDGTCRLSNAAGPVRQLSMIGCWAEYAVVPQESCVTIEKAVPFDVAALLGCAVTTGVGAALNKADVTPDSTVVVIGAGGVGLSIIMGAKLAGAARIIAIDTSASVEAKARSLGATEFVLATQGNPLSAVLEMTTHGADYVFEAVGHRSLQREAIEYCRPGGKVIFVGLDANDATFEFPSTMVTRTEKVVTGSIFGSACTDRDFRRFAGHYLDGALPVDQLIGRRYGIDDINQAVADMIAGKAGRGVILFDGME